MTRNESLAILLRKLEVVDLVNTVHGVEMEPGVVTHVQITTIIYLSVEICVTGQRISRCRFMFIHLPGMRIKAEQ